jgi:hypothetical protein
MVDELKKIVDCEVSGGSRVRVSDHVLAHRRRDDHQNILFEIVYRGYIIFEVSQLSNIVLTNLPTIYPDLSRFSNQFVVLPREYDVSKTKKYCMETQTVGRFFVDEMGIMTDVDDMGLDHPIFVYHLGSTFTDGYANAIKSMVDYDYEDEIHDHVLAKSGEDAHKKNLFNIIQNGYIIFEVSQLSQIILTIRDYHPDISRWSNHFMVLPMVLPKGPHSLY